jgi:hypothetical protein
MHNIFTHPFPLKTYDSIKDFSLTYLANYYDKNNYVIEIILPPSLKTELDKELSQYDISVRRLIAFKRRGEDFAKPNKEFAHVDYSAPNKPPYHASLILPIEGCADTEMYWMGGAHKLELAHTDLGVPYNKIRWEEEPKIIHSVEINEPTLTRVDIPHNVLSNQITGGWRTVVTLRFTHNPSFEEIIQKRFKILI